MLGAHVLSDNRRVCLTFSWVSQAVFWSTLIDFALKLGLLIMGGLNQLC